MPVHTSLLKIENSFDPQFDKRMINLANSTHVKYLNFADDSTQYSYTDGNHLYIKDAKKYSIRLAERIKYSQSLVKNKLNWEAKESLEQAMKSAWDWEKRKDQRG